MKPKKITSCMLFAMIFSCGMSLQAANIKAVNFIHDNSIRGCDIHLSQEGNKYFADVYNQQQTIEMWVRISETLDAQGGVLISTKSAFVDDPANDNKSGGYELMLQPNGWARATFCVGNGGNEPKWVNTQLQAGEWAKLSMVIDRNKLICYKNGEKNGGGNFQRTDSCWHRRPHIGCQSQLGRRRKISRNDNRCQNLDGSPHRRRNKIRFELLFRLKKREPLSQLEHAGRRRHDIEKLDAFE